MSINNGFSFSSVGFKFIENCVNSAFRYETLRFTTKKAAGSTRTPGLVKFAHNILNKSTFVSDTNTDNVKKGKVFKIKSLIKRSYLNNQEMIMIIST